LKARLKAQGRSYGDARGLARLEIKAPDTLVVFATRPNTIAADGQGRRNSPFTEAFLENVSAPGIEIEVLMKRLTASVAAKTQGRQEPERLSRLKSEFYFVPTVSGSTVPGAILSAPSNEAPQAWADVKDTKNQPMLEEFIKHFGDSFYAALARVRLEELKKKAGPDRQITATEEIEPGQQPAEWIENGVTSKWRSIVEGSHPGKGCVVKQASNGKIRTLCGRLN
jgi:hypothetical protein